MLPLEISRRETERPLPHGVLLLYQKDKNGSSENGMKPWALLRWEPAAPANGLPGGRLHLKAPRRRSLLPGPAVQVESAAQRLQAGW